MKDIITNWRNFSKGKMIRINYLESNKRFILEELSEISDEKFVEFPISQQELNKIKLWGGLNGQPRFLGSGTMGTAYQFGNKVLKITSDVDEAQAAYLIEGKFHPNVYHVYKVGKRHPEYKELPAFRFVIIYELLNYPAKEMEEPAKNLWNAIKAVRGSPEFSIWYKWKETYPELSERLFNDFITCSRNNKDVVERELVGKFQSYENKLDKLISNCYQDKEEKELFKTLWIFFFGLYGNKLDSIESIEEHVNKIVGSNKLKYINQLASGLTFLKNNGIVFTDLKTTNIMERDDQVVIIDVGYSRLVQRRFIDIPTIGINEDK